MHRLETSRGVTVVDVVIVLAVVVLLVLVAAREFPHYEHREAPTPAAAQG